MNTEKEKKKGQELLNIEMGPKLTLVYMDGICVVGWSERKLQP